MNVTTPMLLVSTVVTAFAPQSGAQETNQPRDGSRRPVDVSVEGLGEGIRRTAGAAARSGSLALMIGPAAPLACARTIEDKGTGDCVMASSSPTSGALFPYPGIDNVFAPPAFVGGGENNQATRAWATVAGGRDNQAVGVATVGGGVANTARYGTVAGGGANFAFLGATVAGGTYNTARNYSSVGGGAGNTASGWGPTVSGGGSCWNTGNRPHRPWRPLHRPWPRCL